MRPDRALIAVCGLGLLARAGLALTAVQWEDKAAAEEHYGALELAQNTLILIFPDTTCIDHLLGILSHTMGKLDQAAAHFEDAVAFCRSVGARPELAWTSCDYADSLRERNTEGDLAQAMTLLEESLAISSELGMRPLMERVLSRREILRA